MKRLVALTIILGVLVTTLIWFPGEDEKKVTYWPDLSVDMVDSVHLPGCRVFLENGGWRVASEQKGVAPPAKRDKVEGLIRFVDSKSPRRELGKLKEKKRAKYGLDHPQYIKFQGKKGVELFLGKENPSGNGVYAFLGKNPERLLLLDTNYLKQAKHGFDYFADLAIYDLKPEDIQKIAFSKRGKQVWEVSRNGTGFGFNKPDRATGFSVSRRTMDNFLYQLTHLEGKSITGNLPHSNLFLQFRVQTKKGKGNSTLKVYRTQQGFFALKSDGERWYFSLDQGQVEQLNKSVLSIRDRKVSSFPVSTVQEVDISGKYGNFTFVKKGDKWEDKDTARPFPAIQTFLWRLADLRFKKGPVEENFSGEKDSEMEVELFAGSGEKLFKLALFSVKQDQKDIFRIISSDLGRKMYTLKAQNARQLLDKYSNMRKMLQQVEEPVTK